MIGLGFPRSCRTLTAALTRSDTVIDMSTTLMLCAMNFESDIASKRLGNRCVIRTIGVGEHCAHALKDLANEFGAGTNVILCGLAGGLSARAKLGQAYVASHVTAPNGSVIPAPWMPSGVNTPPLASKEFSSVDTPMNSAALPLFCADVLLADTHVKAQTARQFSCDMVDMESAHFARAAAQAGWRWLIVRGVSDDVQTQLPPGVFNFVNPAGAPRPLAIALHVATHPWQIPLLRHLGQKCTLAMNNACDIVERALMELPS